MIRGGDAPTVPAAAGTGDGPRCVSDMRWPERRSARRYSPPRGNTRWGETVTGVRRGGREGRAGRGDRVAAEILDPLVHLPGLRRALVARAGKLRPNPGEPPGKRGDPLRGRQGQHGRKRGVGGVEGAGAEPDHREIDVRERLSTEPVLLARPRPSVVHTHGTLQFCGCLTMRAVDLAQGRTSEVVVCRPRDGELTADLQQVVVILALAGVMSGSHRAPGSVRVTPRPARTACTWRVRR